MEYVEGIDLGRLVKEQGPLPVAQAVRLYPPGGAGIPARPERGLVHRDVKPQTCC